MQPAISCEERQLVRWLPGSWYRTGWIPPADLTLDGYCAIVEAMSEIERARPWWWGDLILYGERRYGETYAQAMDLSGLSYDTLAGYVRVCRRFEFCARTQNLSFSHHRALAVDELDGEERDHLLKEAVRLNLSSHGLSDLRRRYVAERRLTRAGDLIDVSDDGREPPRAELEWVYGDKPETEVRMVTGGRFILCPRCGARIILGREIK